MHDILCVADENKICRGCVKSIFLVCGGNDVENIHNKGSLIDIIKCYDSLLDYIEYIFPSAVINVMSLIPRRLRYGNHLQYMLEVNDKLNDLCIKRENCRFINIFSCFLWDKRNFFQYNGHMILNEKLYVKDRLHLSHTGNSVLGKVIMGVAYNPRS